MANSGFSFVVWETVRLAEALHQYLRSTFRQHANQILFRCPEVRRADTRGFVCDITHSAN